MGAVEVAEIPSFSHPGGVFSDPFTLELTVTSPNALIAYTLDGTIPGETSTPGSARVLIEDDFTNPAGLMPNEIEGFSPIPIGGEWQSNHAGHKGTPGADNDGVDLCDEQTAVQGQLWWSYP